MHDVPFDEKSAFYRLSLFEMFVPYGDPRNPIYCKGVFVLGNVSAAVTANNLQRKPYTICCSENYSQHILALKQWVVIALA